MNVAHTEDKENQQPGKNTNCEASLNFRLETAKSKCSSMKDDRMKFPLWLKISFCHNHALHRAEHVRFLDVSKETKDQFTNLFNQGLTPSAAHAEKRRLIKLEFPETWPVVSADRSRLPPILWVYYWNRQWLDMTVGSRDGVDAYEKAQKMVKEFNEECMKDFPLADGECYAKAAQTENGETVIAVVDPFMYRVHETVPQCGEIVMIDATSNLDRNDFKLFHLVCPSPIGALPLAEIITSREDAQTVFFGLEVLKTVLPANAFFGRGRDVGPQIFMTDDSDAERNALGEAWPQSTLLLCIFHVLQAQWTWLWDGKHGIEHKDKPVLLNLFRRVLYAETEADLSSRLEDMYADKTMLKYPVYQKHLMKDTFPNMKSWSLERRISEELPTSNNNTNNLVECSFRFTKDIQFNRMKAFNLPDMLSLILDKSEFYSNKCVDAANNVINTWLKNCHSKYVIKKPNIDPDSVVEVGQLSFLVPSETQDGVSYFVDMQQRYCTCPQGRLHGPCKHKWVVSQSRNVPSFDGLPSNSPEMRQVYMYLGTGTKMDIDWFLPLQADHTPAAGMVVMEAGTNTGLEDHTNNYCEIVEPTEVSLELREDNVEPRDDNVEPRENNVEPREDNVAPREIKNKLQRILSKLGDKLSARIDHDPSGYSKALDILEKTVDKLPAKGDSALQKSLCSFGKSVTQVKLV